MHILAFLLFTCLLIGALALIFVTLSANAQKIGAALRGSDFAGMPQASARTHLMAANEDSPAVVALAA